MASETPTTEDSEKSDNHPESTEIRHETADSAARFTPHLPLSFVAGGAVAGYFAYRLTKSELFKEIYSEYPGLVWVAFGAIAGLIAWSIVLFIRHRSKHYRFDSFVVTIPSFATLQAAANKAYKHVAWVLFVETSTRIATQSLDDNSGHVRESLDSLYSLFNKVRTLLSDMTPSPESKNKSVEFLAICMLNRELRPFLSKWHPKVPSDTEASPEDLAECREELATLRRHVIEYSRAFGEIAGVSQLDSYFP